MTDELVRSYMHDSATPLKYKEVIAEALASIPRLSHIQFCQHLVFLHQCVNHKEISVLKLLGQRALPAIAAEPAAFEIHYRKYGK